MIGLGTWIMLAHRAKGYRETSAKRIAGIRRVVVYVIVVSAVLGAGMMRRAQAQTAEVTRGLGRDLASLADVLGDGKEIRINGERIHVASSVVETDLATTLDRFEKNCAESPSALTHDRSGKIPQSILDTLGTVRSNGDGEGSVLCLVRGEGATDLTTAFQDFARTQDLGALGKMRYAYAKKSPDKTGTLVLVAWTDAHYSFASLAAEDGKDAPGTDSAIVPRPAGSRRLLSAEVAGTTYGVRVFESTRAPVDVMSEYDAAMTKVGFTKIADDAKNPHERGYLRGGFVVTVVVEAGEHGGAVASVAELGAIDAEKP